MCVPIMQPFFSLCISAHLGRMKSLGIDGGNEVGKKSGRIDGSNLEEGVKAIDDMRGKTSH